MSNFEKGKQDDKINFLRKREQELLAKRLSQKSGFPYADLSLVFLKTSSVGLIPEDEAKEAHMVVFEKINKNIKVGILSPDYEKTKKIIEKLKNQGFNVEIYIVSENSLNIAWKVYEDIKKTEKKSSGSFNISKESVADFKKELKSIEDIKENISKIAQKNNTVDTSSVLEIILAGALALKSSDIHFEPTENDLRLRYRIDGVLIDVAVLPLKIYSQILSRIKLLSKIMLNIKEKAQDGRFSIDVGGSDIEVRTSIIPGGNGESIVLRLLDPENIAISLEEMGMRKIMYDIFIEEIFKPNGMILTTGPTGSGKTTTLYASLKKIYNPEKKILTIENPIEYHLEGIVQTQTDHSKGYTFSEGLRSALRQDPDVIMVGEIRDEETAEIAVNAALTGHIVFSTLHTNNAAGTFPRLIDLGVNEKTLGSAVNLSIAQRLVRRLCPDCKKERSIEEKESKVIDLILESIKNKEVLEGIQKEKIWDPVGCEKCNHTGYKGRVGIFECIKMDSAIENIITKNPSEREIQKTAEESQGIINMQQDGILKVLEGTTSFKEVAGIVSLKVF